MYQAVRALAQMVSSPVKSQEPLTQARSVEGKLILGRALMWHPGETVLSSEPSWERNRPLVAGGCQLVAVRV